MPGVGQQIRSTRLARGLTQQGLARAAGMAQGDVSLIERGLTNPTVRTVERLVEVIGTRTIRVSARQGVTPKRVPGVLHPVTPDEAPAVEWLVEGFLSRGAVTMLAGAPGAGKSLLAQSIAAAAVSGNHSVAGIEVEPARVCIVDGENGEDLIQRRFSALGLEAAAWGTRLRVFQAEGFDLVSDLEQLDATLSADPCDLLILDAWTSLWSGSETSVPAVKQCLGGLRTLSRTHRLGTVLIHHTTKGTTTYRGSGAIASTLEAVFTLTRSDRDPERVLACQKMRLGPEPPARNLEVSEAGFREQHRFA
jgi:transcriptional regulator with XRE-family HTH domain